MEYEKGNFKRLNENEEINRQVELRNKYLSDLNTNLAGAKSEGYKEGIRIAISKILKNRPDMQVEEVAELLEMSLKEVVAIKNELNRF